MGSRRVEGVGVMAEQREALVGALDAAAGAADEAADAQRNAATVARQAARAERNGQDSGDRIKTVLGLLHASATQVSAASSALRRAWAHALAADGLPRRRIGALLGVTHQRVSALLHRSEPESTGS